MVYAPFRHRQLECVSVISIDADTSTTSASAFAPSRRPMSSGRRVAVSGTITQRINKARRVKLFVFVRILFQYLEKVDQRALNLAKVVLKDCEKKHKTNNSKYSTLADAISDRLRDEVGESHWAHARRIQKQLMMNQRKQKTIKLGLVGLGQHCTL